MFIVVYFVLIVYYVCFEDRSKMGLSCPHFIFFPKRERCQNALFLTQIVGRYVYSTCGEIELSIYFCVRISMQYVFLAVRVVFICRFSRRSCL